METMTKEELMSLIDKTRKQIDQWLSFEGPIFLIEHKDIRKCLIQWNERNNTRSSPKEIQIVL